MLASFQDFSHIFFLGTSKKDWGENNEEVHINHALKMANFSKRNFTKCVFCKYEELGKFFY